MNDVQHLGSIDGARIAVQIGGTRQNILIEHSSTGRHLVRLLGAEPNHLPTIQVEGVNYWTVEHHTEVDTVLKQTIDILISIRYSHPTFVQLRMELT
jgi:hypothetical protein